MSKLLNWPQKLIPPLQKVNNLKIPKYLFEICFDDFLVLDFRIYSPSHQTKFPDKERERNTVRQNGQTKGGQKYTNTSGKIEKIYPYKFPD